MTDRVYKNAAWIIVCRIIQAILSFVISMMTARYLGPANFGLINYASSLTGFAAPVMHLGINSVIVRELVAHPDQEGEILGTSVITNFVSSLFCMLGIAVFVICTTVNERDTLYVCVLYSILLAVQSLECMGYWFQAKLLAKYTSVVGLIAYVIVSVYRLYLLVTAKSIYWFCVSNAFDVLIIALASMYLYHKLGGRPLRFSGEQLGKLLSSGKYYIVSDMMVTVFAQTDRVMLKNMLGNEATGYYSAAIQCTLITSFVFSAVLDSARPVIFGAKDISEEAYERNICRLYSLLIYLSLAQSIVVTLLARWIILIIYGDGYNPAVLALQIAVWYMTFSYLGSGRNIWILGEKKQGYLWKINLVGAVTNVILNFILIPKFGVNGAAIASLATQFFTNVGTGLLFKEIRHVNTLMFRSMKPEYMIGMLKQLTGKN